MEGVQFEDEKIKKRTARTTNKPPLITFLLKTGFFQTNNQVVFTLLILSVALFICAGYIFYEDTKPKQFESDYFPEGYLNDPNYIQKYGSQ